MCIAFNFVKQLKLNEGGNKFVNDQRSFFHNYFEVFEQMNGNLFRNDIINKVIPVESLYISIYDEENNIILFPFSTLKVIDENKPLNSRKPGKGLLEYIIRNGKSFLYTRENYRQLIESGDVDEDEIIPPSWIGVPLIVEKKTIGALVISKSSNNNIY